jgi:hypothetical protein
MVAKDVKQNELSIFPDLNNLGLPITSWGRKYALKQ